MACCRHANEEMLSGMDGRTHGTRRAFTGNRFRESYAPSMPTLGRRRSTPARPAERCVGGMA